MRIRSSRSFGALDPATVSSALGWRRDGRCAALRLRAGRHRRSGRGGGGHQRRRRHPRDDGLAGRRPRPSGFLTERQVFPRPASAMPRTSYYTLRRRAPASGRALPVADADPKDTDVPARPARTGCCGCPCSPTPPRCPTATSRILVGDRRHRACSRLCVSAVFAREVLAYDQGTPKMQEISKAVQEGASAYLRRQFMTLAPFAVIIFGLLFILPAETVGTADRALGLLPRRRGLLGVRRFCRHDPGDPGQRPYGCCGAGERDEGGHAGWPSAPAARSACSRSASACSVPAS